MKNNFLKGLFLGMSVFLLMAAKITDDNLLIGNPATTDDKELIFNTNDGANNQTLKVEDSSFEFLFGRGANQNERLRFDLGLGASNPYIGYDSTEGALVFSNDGVEIKKIGSGSGGGQGGTQYLDNGSFEDGVDASNGWVSTGVVPTQETFTNFSEGDEFYARVDFSAAAQIFESALVTLPDNSQDGCSIEFEYLGADTNVTVSVEDNSANVLLAPIALVAQTGWTEFERQHFPCASQMKIVFDSLADAAVMDLNKVYLGSTLGVSSLNSIQKEVLSYQEFNDDMTDRFGELQYNLANLNESGTDLITPADDGGNTRTTFTVNENDVRLSITVAGLIADVNSKICVANNGTIFMRGTSNYSGGVFSSTAVVDYPVAQGDVITVGICQDLQSFDAGRSLTNIGTVVHHFEMVASKIVQNNVFEPETKSFYVDASIGGANFGAFTATSTATEMTNGASDMVINKGSAKIPCSGTNASTGLTCSSGNESLGIVVDLPSAGDYEFCSSVNYSDTGGFSGIRQYITENNAQTELQKGTSIIATDTDKVAGRLCDVFSFSSAGEVTMRLKYESTSNSLFVFAAREGTAHERDVNITVKKVAQNVVEPILVGGGLFHDDGPSAKRLKYRRLIFGGAGGQGVCTSTPCTIREISAGWSLTGNITVPSGGRFQFSVPAGTFKNNEYVSCDCQAQSGVDNTGCNFNTVSGSQNAMQAQSDGSYDFDIMSVANNGTLRDAQITFECISEE